VARILVRKLKLLLYSTWVALPIDGCHKGLNLHHPLNHITVAILVTDAIVKSFFAVHAPA